LHSGSGNNTTQSGAIVVANSADSEKVLGT